MEVSAIHSVLLKITDKEIRQTRQAYLHKPSSEDPVFFPLRQIKVKKGLRIQLLLLDSICLAWVKGQLLHQAHLVPKPSRKTLRSSQDPLVKK